MNLDVHRVLMEKVFAVQAPVITAAEFECEKGG